VLAVIGFKIKGVWGAAWALAGGVVWFLYNEGIIRF
jgi:urea transporter